MVHHDYDNGLYDSAYNTSSYTHSHTSSYPQQPCPATVYSQQQSPLPSSSQQSYPAVVNPRQHSSSYPYANQPSSYQQSISLSSVPMPRTDSISSSRSSGSVFSRNDYPGSSNPTSPGSEYEIDLRYAIAPSSKSKGRQQAPLAPPAKGDKPFFCLEPGCEFRTAREFDLKRHMKNHFEPAPEDMFPCPGKNCIRVGKHAFKRKDHMMEHVANYHDGYVNGKRVVVPKKKGGSKA